MRFSHFLQCMFDSFIVGRGRHVKVKCGEKMEGAAERNPSAVSNKSPKSSRQKNVNSCFINKSVNFSASYCTLVILFR